jgi:multiple sugar transport system substrate-binding protein
MTHHISRRGFGVGAAALGLTAATPSLAQATRLRMLWWGGQDRARRTNEIIAAYQARAGVQIDGESFGWGDYWPRVATQTAGGNPPDVLQMDFRYLAEYGRRGALLGMNAARTSGVMPLPGFSDRDLAAGSVGGQLYAVACGWNTTSTFHNVSVLERSSAPKPKVDMSWTELADWAVAVTDATQGRVFGSENGGWNEQGLEVWVRQRGKALYTDDGQLAFGRDDIAEWLDFWSKLQARRGTPPADVQALSRRTIETSLLVLGRAALIYANSNQLVGFQGGTQDKVEIGMYPRGSAGQPTGSFLKPAMLMSVPARSRNQEAAARFINFMMTDPAAGLIGGVERGVPPSAAVRTSLAPTMDELGRRQLAFIDFMQDKVTALPPSPPQGAGEIDTLLVRINESVSFGRLTVPRAADQFMADARTALAK